jgi:competence protein ComEC
MTFNLRFNLYAVVLAFVLFSATPLASENVPKEFIVVWNVGQGQWATLKDQYGCHHFDMGGEFNPLRKVTALCGKSKNYIYLSHWDLDHISFVGRSAQYLPNRCLVLGPLGTSSAKKMKAVLALPHCAEETAFHWQELTHLAPPLSLPEKGAKKSKVSSNELSHVVLAENRYLIPGDSDARAEKVWDRSPSLPLTKWLLLGHHGSRTSTSEDLLSRMPNLKVAIASARARRYGHPHLEVVALLRYHHVPLLRTEDWGNLWFEIAPH